MTKVLVDNDEVVRHYDQHGKAASSDKTGTDDSSHALAERSGLGSRDPGAPERNPGDRIHHRSEDASNHDGEGSRGSRRIRSATNLPGKVFAGEDTEAVASGSGAACVWRFREGACHAGGIRQEVFSGRPRSYREVAR